jgi:hypothetical protein
MLLCVFLVELSVKPTAHVVPMSMAFTRRVSVYSRHHCPDLIRLSLSGAGTGLTCQILASCMPPDGSDALRGIR